MRIVEGRMTKGRLLPAALLILTPYALAQWAPKLTTIYDFPNGVVTGDEPNSKLLVGQNGTLYGTAGGGGSDGYGVVFSLTPPAQAGLPWTETILDNFGPSNWAQGETPNSLMAYHGVLYGTTAYAGNSGQGTAFSLTPPATPSGAWSVAVLHSFGGASDGASPGGPLLVGKGGVLYGTTLGGGTGSCSFLPGAGCGTVFSLKPPASPGSSWSETVLHSFQPSGADGIGPNAGLVFGLGDRLYGTTHDGGISGVGTVFSLTPPTIPGGKWTETILYNFTGGSDGLDPASGLVIGRGGVLYGTTNLGGSSGSGTVFSLTPPLAGRGNWTLATLYSFPGGTGGDLPAATLLLAKNRVLVGTTTGVFSGSGTVFALKPPATEGAPWMEITLHSFSGSDGASPAAGLVFGSGGILYGTTAAGGTAGSGTVFSLVP